MTTKVEIINHGNKTINLTIVDINNTIAYEEEIAPENKVEKYIHDSNYLEIREKK